MLMHRYNIASDLIPGCRAEGEAGLVAMATWFRFAALRQLVWNNDYNIKAARDFAAQPVHHELAALTTTRPCATSCVDDGHDGRGGEATSASAFATKFSPCSRRTTARVA